MSSQAPLPKPLNVPLAESAHFARNFIRVAVRELRFSTLFELTESERPSSNSREPVRSGRRRA